MAEEVWYTCSVVMAGPATDGSETPAPVVYVILSDTGNNPSVFSNQPFYVANGGQNQMLAVALAAINGGKYVQVAAYPPNAAGTPYTSITRMYLMSTPDA